MNRTCPLPSSVVPLRFTLTAVGVVSVGGTFVIYDQHGGKLDEWKLSTDETNKATHTSAVTSNAARAALAVVVWEVAMCSLAAGATIGTYSVEVDLNSAPCPVTPPISNALSNLPQCSDGQSVIHRDMIRFTQQVEAAA
jgi:hypothetical protein